MTIADGSVVSSPVVHDAIDILEGILRGIETWGKPGGRPSGVSTLVQNVVGLGIEFYRPTLSQLQYRPQSCHKVQTEHRHWHTTLCDEV